MKILIDFFPILLFFGAYKMYDIYTGTAVLMAATVVQMALIYGIDRKLQAMHKITLALILIFGTLTLVLHDERFIKWKPTVLYAAMAIGLAVAVWVLKKFSQNAAGQPADSARTRLDAAEHGVGGLLCLHGHHQWYLAAYYSTEAWVNFKLWGYAFPLVFIVGQGFYVSRYLTDDNAKEPAP